MKLIRNFFALCAVLAFSSAVFADDCCDDDCEPYELELLERDWDALYDYINTKRTINVEEKACALTISGDVRGEWRYTTEEICNNRLRGGYALDSDGLPIPNSLYNSVFNLRFDYVCNRAWAVAHFEFDNGVGVSAYKKKSEGPANIFGSGRGCEVALKKAYIGYNLCCNGCDRFDIEVGRRRLFQVFDSQVQFLSRFDGVLLRYDSCFDCLGDWYIKGAGFVIDELTNHYGWVAEAGLLDVMDSGLDFKYSIIDWRKKGHNRWGINDPVGCKYLISQWTGYYHFTPEMLNMPTKLYAAFLYNHEATPASGLHLSNPENVAWYVGMTVGEVSLAGDWSLDLQFQWVELYSVPSKDMSGIGIGNIGNLNPYAIDPPFGGNTNFYGIRIEGLYALTDNLSFDARYEWSKNIIPLGTIVSHNFNQFRLEVIYAF